MQFKDFIWPHNPSVYSVDYQRSMAVHKVPFGRYTLQNLGMTQRVLKGEGEFIGEDAYRQFKQLAALFYQETSGVLIHPVWQSTKAYFVELSLVQEPRQDYVKYRFTFWEDYEGYAQELRKLQPVQQAPRAVSAAQSKQTKIHAVAKGETLWKIATSYGLTMAQILSLNPQIKNPNRIYPGEQVRLA
jgi:LysM repeat protein